MLHSHVTRETTEGKTLARPVKTIDGNWKLFKVKTFELLLDMTFAMQYLEKGNSLLKVQILP